MVLMDGEGKEGKGTRVAAFLWHARTKQAYDMSRAT
jgi:hypothetical protein